MYAVLVVSIWSEMESFLKRLVRLLYRTNEKSQPVPYKFPAIKGAINNEAGIDLQDCSSYSTVDAIRELNNLFKHSDGYCAHGDKFNLIRKSKLTAMTLTDVWTGKKVMVEYSKLPIHDLLNACNEFCSVLLDRVKNKLKVNP